MTTQHVAPTHYSAAELDERLAIEGAAPLNAGTVSLIIARPEVDQRTTPQTATLDTEGGLGGDNWSTRPTRTGPPDPDKQLNIIGRNVLAAIADTADRWPLAGDQFVLDLDISVDNLPAGTRIGLGTAVIEVTAAPHTGCAKFSERFGIDATRWANSDIGSAQRRRGLCAKVVTNGEVSVGDEARVLERP